MECRTQRERCMCASSGQSINGLEACDRPRWHPTSHGFSSDVKCGAWIWIDLQWGDLIPTSMGYGAGIRLDL